MRLPIIHGAIGASVDPTDVFRYHDETWPIRTVGRTDFAMIDSVGRFFDAWALTDATERASLIASAVGAKVYYTDPRTPSPITGPAALADYVGMFSANAPGWSAKVVKQDTCAGVIRATVAFGGPGPDGSTKVQHGQYFIETDGDLIVRMVGFVGTGAVD